MAVAAAIVLTVVLLLYSLGLRVASILHERDMSRLRAYWWPVFAVAALADHVSTAGERRHRSRRAEIKLLREWCRFRGLVLGISAEGLEALAIELELLDLARRLLRHRSVPRKLLAIQALGYLRDRESWHEIHAALAHDNSTISVMAATALVYIDAELAIPLVVPQIAERITWPRTQIGRMLNVAGPAIVTGPLCRAIEIASSDKASRLLQFHESAHIAQIDSLAAQLLLSRSDPTLLAAALKSIRGHLPDALAARLAKHGVWYVRMQAASLLGRFGRREDYCLLEPLLADPEWWVRYRAAQAITKLPFLGPNALRKLRDRQTDEFARDILHQSLAEGGIA